MIETINQSIWYRSEQGKLLAGKNWAQLCITDGSGIEWLRMSYMYLAWACSQWKHMKTRFDSTIEHGVDKHGKIRNETNKTEFLSRESILKPSSKQFSFSKNLAQNDAVFLVESTCSCCVGFKTNLNPKMQKINQIWSKRCVDNFEAPNFSRPLDHIWSCWADRLQLSHDAWLAMKLVPILVGGKLRGLVHRAWHICQVQWLIKTHVNWWLYGGYAIQYVGDHDSFLEIRWPATIKEQGNILV
jgi:hypothetical protein